MLPIQDNETLSCNAAVLPDSHALLLLSNRLKSGDLRSCCRSSLRSQTPCLAKTGLVYLFLRVVRLRQVFAQFV